MVIAGQAPVLLRRRRPTSSPGRTRSRGRSRPGPRRASSTPRQVGAALLLVLNLIGCANDDPDLVRDLVSSPPLGMVSRADDVQPVLNANCAVPGCHSGSFPAQDLSLEASSLYDPQIGAVGVASREAAGLDRIEPGSAEMSYLVNKIEGTQLQVGGQGERMPFACADSPSNCNQPGFCLCDATIQVIRDWIDQGAQDN